MKKSVYWDNFIRHCTVAARTGLAALFSVIFILVRQTSQWMAVPFFSTVMAILITDVSLGRGLRNAWMVVCGTVIAASTATFFRHIFGPSVAAMMSCLAVVSLVFSYPNVHALGKRISLAVSAISYLQFAANPELSLLFPLRLGGSALFGAACSVMAMMLPWPQLAISEVQSSSHSLARSMAALFNTLIDVFCSEDKRTVASARIHARVLAKMATSCLNDLKERQVDLQWELGAWGASPALGCLIEAMDGLIRHAEGMELGLEEGAKAEPPRSFILLLKEPLRDLAEEAQAALVMVVENLSTPCDSVQAKDLVDKGKKLLVAFNEALRRAREVAYYHVAPEGETNNSDALAGSIIMEEGDDFLAQPRSNTASLMASYFFLFNARRFICELLRLVGGLRKDGSQKKRRGASEQATTLHAVDSVENFLRPHVPEQPLSGLYSPPSSPLRASQGLSLGSHTHDDPQEPTELKSFIWKLLTSGEMITTPVEFKLKIDSAKIKGSFKIALAMSAAALAGRAISVVDSFWAPVTVAFVVVAGYQGGSFKLALLRLQGTVMGAIFGYLALLVTRDNDVALASALVTWVVFASFIRHSSPYGYAGLVAAFTAPIIMLGYQRQGDGFKTYALSRITQTCVGILCFITVEIMVWPVRAVNLVRGELQQCLSSCRSCAAAIVASYMDDECQRCRKNAVEDVVKLESDISRSLTLQDVLANEALAEPDYWYPPFPAVVYTRLMVTQGHILRLLYFMDCSLRATLTDVSDDQMSRLLGPLREPLQALEGSVLGSLDVILDALNSKIPKLSTKPAEDSNDQTHDPDLEQIREDEGGNSHSNTASLAEQETIFSLLRGKSGSRRKEVYSHPLLRLSSRWRNFDGLDPPNVQDLSDSTSALQDFVHRYEELLAVLIRDKREHPETAIVNNVVVLSFNSLVFSMKALMEETEELEFTVGELLQVEQPLDLNELSELQHATASVPLKSTAEA